LLAAISLHRIGFGLLLILAFGTGMAGVLAGTGMLLVYATRLMERFQFHRQFSRATPFVTALIVLVVGLVMALRAASQAGLF
ncbi:MAG TPA: ABC transporter permease, partial [Dehalococcoidia bacterium]|nr:ABC transporter permease [Dehalococcoidia bacterium]